jgi:hypothetical protein
MAVGVIIREMERENVRYGGAKVQGEGKMTKQSRNQAVNFFTREV